MRPNAGTAIAILVIVIAEAEQASARTHKGDNAAVDHWRMLFRDKDSS
jgi:hypothetical protein